MRHCIYVFIISCILALPKIITASNPTNQPDIDSLIKRIDFIENKVNNTKSIGSQNRLLARGATRQWGDGLNWGFNLLQPCNPSFDIGYKFALQHEENNYEVTDSKKMFMGVKFIGKMYSLDALFLNDYDKPTAYSVGANIVIASPVLLNFISLSGHFGPFIQWGYKDDNSNITEAEIGLELGNSIEFWLTKNTSLSIGFILDPTIGNIKGSKDLMNPTEMKLAYGFRHYFGKKSRV